MGLFKKPHGPGHHSVRPAPEGYYHGDEPPLCCVVRLADAQGLGLSAVGEESSPSKSSGKLLCLPGLLGGHHGQDVLVDELHGHCGPFPVCAAVKAGLPGDELACLFVVAVLIWPPAVIRAQTAADGAAPGADAVDGAVVFVVDVDEPAVRGELVVVDHAPWLAGAARAHAALRTGATLGVVYPGATVVSEDAEDVGHTTTVDDDGASQQS